jgi:hypothetical protein
MQKIPSEFLNSHDQELRLEYLVEIRKQGALEETEEPQLEERNMTALS